MILYSRLDVAFQLRWSKLESDVIYQLQQETAEVGPHPVRLWSVSVRKVNQVQEQALVDVKVLGEKKKGNLDDL